MIKESFNNFGVKIRHEKAVNVEETSSLIMDALLATALRGVFSGK